MNFVFLMDSSSFIGIALVLLFILDLLPYFTCMNVLLVFVYVHHVHAGCTRG